jgi:hypothetical protein
VAGSVHVSIASGVHLPEVRSVLQIATCICEPCFWFALDCDL